MLTAAKKAVSIYGSGGSVPDQSFSVPNSIPKQEKMPTPNYDLTGFTSAQKNSLSNAFSSGGQSASDSLYNTMSTYNKSKSKINQSSDKSNIIKQNTNPVSPTGLPYSVNGKPTEYTGDFIVTGKQIGRAHV